MTARKSSKVGSLRSTPFHSNLAFTREDIWFDDTNNYLYLDFRKTCATCIRIATWKKGLSVERWNQALDTWQSEEWDPGIPLPLAKAKTIFPLEEFYSEFPSDVLCAVAPFKWRQFVLLRMIRHCPETMELLQSNPVLTWLCADAIARNEIPVTKAREKIMAKRRDICAFVGLPATESVVKTLSRIKSKEYTQTFFDDLQKVFLLDDKMLKLRSVPFIPGEEIHNLLNQFEYTYWLLSTRDSTDMTIWENLTDDNEIEVYRLWTDSKRCAKSLNMECPENHLKKCQSIEALQVLHNLWADRYSALHQEQRIEQFFTDNGTYTFPTPPLPGDADIVPITTIKELLEEGAVMHNCVGSYAEKVKSGECYIYRVLRPQRATLEISDSGDMHHIRQLKLVRNSEPSAEVWEKVRFWFANALQPHEKA